MGYLVDNNEESVKWTLSPAVLVKEEVAVFSLLKNSGYFTKRAKKGYNQSYHTTQLSSKHKRWQFKDADTLKLCKVFSAYEVLIHKLKCPAQFTQGQEDERFKRIS